MVAPNSGTLDSAMRPTIYVPFSWAWRAVKMALWFVLLGVAAANHLGGWFFVLSVVWLIPRAWVRSRPPVAPVQPSEKDVLRMLWALHYLRGLEKPEHVEARRER